MAQFAVILPAAGASTRYGGSKSKLMEQLGDRIVLAHSLRAFLVRSDVACVVIPTRATTDLLAEPALKDELSDPRVRVCVGGDSRAASVRNALLLVPPSVQWAAVHDAARPLVSQGLIDRTFAAAQEHGAAAPAMAVTLTIKQATGPLPARVLRTIPRHELWAMQTPQIARREDLLEAFEKCPLQLEQVTDDVHLLELAGKPVWLVQGEERNLKITTPIDLKVAEMFMRG